MPLSPLPSVFQSTRNFPKQVLVIDSFGRHGQAYLAHLDQFKIRLAAPWPITPGRSLDENLEGLIEDRGRYPIALLAPPGATLSQLIEQPAGSSDDVRSFIEKETGNLSGLSESEVVYDYNQLTVGADRTDRYWVTVGKESPIADQLESIIASDHEICSVSNRESALAAAFESSDHYTPSGLVGGAVVDGHIVSLAIFSNGICEFSSTAIDNETQSALGLSRFPQLETLLKEWLATRPRSKKQLANLKLQLHLAVLDDLVGQQESAIEAPCAIEILPWTQGSGEAILENPLMTGLALIAVGQSDYRADLMPSEIRQRWTQGCHLLRLESVVALFAFVVALFLIVGASQHLSLIHHKQRLSEKLAEVKELAIETQALTLDLESDYEVVRPLLRDQWQSAHITQSLIAVSEIADQHQGWLTVFADTPSYYKNASRAGTNAVPTITSATYDPDSFIVEICLPGDAESARLSLNEVVAELKKNSLFSNVDTISDDLRRAVAEPEVFLPKNHFSLSLAVEANAYRYPIYVKASSRPADVEPPVTEPPPGEENGQSEKENE